MFASKVIRFFKNCDHHYHYVSTNTTHDIKKRQTCEDRMLVMTKSVIKKRCCNCKKTRSENKHGYYGWLTREEFEKHKSLGVITPG